MLHFCDKSWIYLDEAGNGREIAGSQSELMNGCVFEP